LTYLFFERSNGVQVWYLYEGRCETCRLRKSCLNVLKAEAEERGIELSEEDLSLQPTRLDRKNIIFDWSLDRVNRGRES
jgi:hypothetical protein